MKKPVVALISLLVVSLFVGCSTVGPPRPAPQQPVSQQPTPPSTDQTQAQNPTPPDQSGTQSDQGATQPPPGGDASSQSASTGGTTRTATDAAQNGGSQSAASGSSSGTYVVSKELFNKTFNEVEQVISDLNEIISREDFTTWKSYLTDDYINALSNPAKLAELSQSPILKRNNITLKSLQDYFHYVVVPSRSNLRLDDLVFIDENTVEAIMEVRGQRAILYQLEKRDGTWKIGL